MKILSSLLPGVLGAAFEPTAAKRKERAEPKTLLDIAVLPFVSSVALGGVFGRMGYRYGGPLAALFTGSVGVLGGALVGAQVSAKMLTEGFRS
jgi:hypothetical protein